MELSEANKFDCGNIITEEMIKMDYIDCPFCDEELQQPTIKIDSCSEKQDIINNKGMNVCRNCGSVHSYGTASEYIDFYENKYRFIKRSVYQRKHHLDNVLNDLSSKNGWQISVQNCNRSSSNNLLLGSSITKSGLHRGPNTRYILYNDTIKIYKLELKPK